MPLYLMFTISDRRKLPDYIALYKARRLPVNCVALGHGTAKGELLNVLGLDSSERAVCLTVCTWETWEAVRRDLRRKLRIDVPGSGVAFLVPMSSVGGRRELAFLSGGRYERKGEESVMRGTEWELLVVISNRGFNDMVMDAARDAGAHGGTVLSARGTGAERAEQFLGISLASEKDVTLIVTRTVRKNDLMRSIMKKAGLGTQAKSVVFSLPVTSTAGFRLLNEEEEVSSEGESQEESSGKT